MRYLSCKELSRIWKISTRRIQQFCAQGKIASACRVGNIWIIDENAKKPLLKQRTSPFLHAFLITDSILFKYGDSESTINNLPCDEKIQAIFEINFFRGNISNTYEYYLSLPSNHTLKICAMNLALLEAIAQGNIKVIKEISIHQSKLAEKYAYDSVITSILNYTRNFIDSYFSYEIILPTFNSVSFLPKNLIKIAIWLNCCINQYNKKHTSNIDLLETYLLLSNSIDGFYILDIYITLMCGISYYITGDTEKAEYFIYKSLSMGIQDSILLPYSKFFPLIGNIIEKSENLIYTGIFDKIKNLTQSHQCFYFSFYNCSYENTSHYNFSILELKIIAHIINDFSNKEIGEKLDLSISYVKKSIESIYEKLLISNRKEMKNLFKIV